MFDFVVAFLQICYYIILFTFVPITFLVRLFIARKSEKPLKARLLVILDVTSLSYYTFLPRDDKHYKVYNITLIIYAVFALFAFIYGIHMFI